MTPRPDWLPRRAANEWSIIGVVCPACRGAFTDGPGETLRCRACDRSFPQPLGIPDLRLGSDPYLSREEDLAAAVALARRGDALDFAALNASYYEGNEKVSAAQAAQFTRGVLSAGARSRATLRAWAAETGEPFIDLGCGTGPLALAAAATRSAVLGIDVGMRWLVLAARRSADAGRSIPFVCANAEALPIPDGWAAVVAGESVIENVDDHRPVLGECHRVLAREGRLCLTTPSRWFLGPDPHVGVLAGGWWPEDWLRRRVESAGAVFPRRHFFSPRTLRAALREAGFAAIRVASPAIADEQIAGLDAPLAAAVRALAIAGRVPGLRAVLQWLGPGFTAVAIAAALLRPDPTPRGE
jgi:SAM-dependent methyltransferase